ncbi:hypothetical protein NSTCB13_03909 [Nostoc sp. DSM 114160]
MATQETRPSTDLPVVAPEYNGIDRNAFLFGWTPQAEIWNGSFGSNWLSSLFALGFGWL